MKKVFFLYCISLLCIYGCNDDSDKYSSNFLKSREVTLNAEGGDITVEGREKFILVQTEEILNQDTIFSIGEIKGVAYQGGWYQLEVNGKEMTLNCDRNLTGNKRKVVLHFQGTGNSFDVFSLTQLE